MSERVVRIVKIAGKVFGGFCGSEGAKLFVTIQTRGESEHAGKEFAGGGWMVQAERGSIEGVPPHRAARMFIAPVPCFRAVSR